MIWVKDTIGHRVSLTLRESSAGYSKLLASITPIELGYVNEVTKHTLMIVGAGKVGRFDTVQEAKDMANILVPMSKQEIRDYVRVAHQLTD